MANKQELVNRVAEKTKLSKKDASNAVNAIFSIITESLADGDNVKIVGFGNFEVRTRQEREGRNPQNQEKIIIPAAKIPHFRAGKILKKAVL